MLMSAIAALHVGRSKSGPSRLQCAAASEQQLVDFMLSKVTDRIVACAFAHPVLRLLKVSQQLDHYKSKLSKASKQALAVP